MARPSSGAVVRAAILFAVAGALKVESAMSRRAAFAKVASLAPLVPLAAVADLKQASDAAVYERADKGVMDVARVLERAKAGKLVDGTSATCQEVERQRIPICDPPFHEAAAC